MTVGWIDRMIGLQETSKDSSLDVLYRESETMFQDKKFEEWKDIISNLEFEKFSKTNLYGFFCRTALVAKEKDMSSDEYKLFLTRLLTYVSNQPDKSDWKFFKEKLEKELKK